MIECPICSKPVKEANINTHIDGNCETFVENEGGGEVQSREEKPSAFTSLLRSSGKKTNPIASTEKNGSLTSRPVNGHAVAQPLSSEPDRNVSDDAPFDERPAKRLKTSSNLAAAAPLADRMRPRTLDEVRGQALVSRDGVLRGLIETNRVPSMILWGGAGTGKTTIARLIAQAVGARFVEINSTSSGVAECKKIFAEARSELSLTGRKTILFCDEIHRFSKAQQDVFLGPVESGQITLVGATTENPSFKVQAALLSRCRTFTLSKLPDEEIHSILKHALEKEGPNYNPSSLVDDSLLTYLSAFADGDARTALNLLELAMETSKRSGMTLEQLKASLTQTLVYDRAGDQHYDTISAFHKSVRGSDPDAALYYLARMIASGEDARFIARRMVVMASEDVGLADNTLLPLATAAYDAAEKIGWPEARIPLAHVTVALALAKKSTRAYRALGNAERLLKQPGMAGLPIPMHLRNAPTRLMKELGYGKQYKYNPDFVEGKCSQEYLPEKLRGVKFLEDRDLGTEEDPELEEGGAGYTDERDNGQDGVGAKKGMFTELSLHDVMSSMS